MPKQYYAGLKKGFIVILETSGFARGLLHFDSSGNGPVRERVVHAFSPHPDPLPRGEGTASTAQWKPRGL